MGGWKDRQMYGCVNNIPIAFLKKRRDNKTCMTSKDSDQPVHPPSMARVLNG